MAPKVKLQGVGFDLERPLLGRDVAALGAEMHAYLSVLQVLRI